jgi:hypothetical protein
MTWLFLRRSRTLDADRCLLWQAFSRDIIGFFRERSVSRDTQEFAGKEIGDAKHSCVQFGSLGVSNFGESYMSFPTKYKHHISKRIFKIYKLKASLE